MRECSPQTILASYRLVRNWYRLKWVGQGFWEIKCLLCSLIWQIIMTDLKNRFWLEVEGSWWRKRWNSTWAGHPTSRNLCQEAMAWLWWRALNFSATTDVVLGLDLWQSSKQCWGDRPGATHGPWTRCRAGTDVRSGERPSALYHNFLNLRLGAHLHPGSAPKHDSFDP